MRVISATAVFAIGLQHLAFLMLEMFLWNGPAGWYVFGTTPQFTAATVTLAANQGLYNGFLAVGLLWSVWRNRLDLKIFFLGCVIVAGVFGGLTASVSIFWVQAVPAIGALAFTLFSSRPIRQREG